MTKREQILALVKEYYEEVFGTGIRLYAHQGRAHRRNARHRFFRRLHLEEQL